MSLLTVQPPDDSGADTFGRYRYQALILVPYCLNCALGGDIVSLVPEHFEDVAMEYRGEWRLVQIKTRNSDRGPWRLSHLLAEGGALHSLVRSWKALDRGEYRFELWLEGPISASDAIVNLLSSRRRDEDLVGRCDGKLELTTADLRPFLEHVVVIPNQPSRASVVALNERAIGQQAPDLTHRQIVEVHARVVERIEMSMGGEFLDQDWPLAAIAYQTAHERLRATIHAKRLTQAVLAPLVAPITSSPRPLLRRLIAASGGRPSMLEEKMIAGGATLELISMAKSLRANATQREFELDSTRADSGQVLDDIRQRLQHRVDALTARHTGAPQSAVNIWLELINILGAQAAAIDARRIFAQDVDLLLGEVCQMADECLTNWGIASA
jgi:Cap4 dsDNA endonuclease